MAQDTSDRADGRHGAVRPRPDSGRERETLELVRAYHRIPDRARCKALLDLIKRLGGQGAGQPPDPPRRGRGS